MRSRLDTLRSYDGKNTRNLGWSRASTLGTVARVITLHIEHPITDYETWRAAFDAFAARSPRRWRHG